MSTTIQPGKMVGALKLSISIKYKNSSHWPLHSAHLERVLTLARDVGNPSRMDPYFPVVRHKDWYVGISWASGIGPGVRQAESSTEVGSTNINAKPYMCLWALLLDGLSGYQLLSCPSCPWRSPGWPSNGSHQLDSACYRDPLSQGVLPCEAAQPSALPNTHLGVWHHWPICWVRYLLVHFELAMWACWIPNEACLLGGHSDHPNHLSVWFVHGSGKNSCSIGFPWDTCWFMGYLLTWLTGVGSFSDGCLYLGKWPVVSPWSWRCWPRHPESCSNSKGTYQADSVIAWLGGILQSHHAFSL